MSVLGPLLFTNITITDTIDFICEEIYVHKKLELICIKIYIQETTLQNHNGMYI